ncbi:DUF2851 family protein [Chloroflexota bacterium]
MHVVMWNGAKATTTLQNGEIIPTIALHKYTPSDSTYPTASSSAPYLKAIERLTEDATAAFLDTEGEERFLAKASRFQINLGQMEAGQCLYQGIMGALGYSKNKPPFIELTRRVPLKTLELIPQRKTSDDECLEQQQAILLGAAGLLPSQRSSRHWQNEPSDEWIDKLERLLTSSHQVETMPSKAWHLFKVRPNNFPVRRIAAMSYLILRYKERGIFNEMVNMTKEAAINKSPHRLEEGLRVTTNGYWASHFDFDSGYRLKNPFLLGYGRAAEIVINVILPFTLAWCQLTSQQQLASKILELYHIYPRLTANALERHMRRQLGLSSTLVNSTRRQQGLIQIYNTLCTQGRCNCCPLSQNPAHITGRMSSRQYTGFQPAY